MNEITCGRPGWYQMCGPDCAHSFPGCALIHRDYDPTTAAGQEGPW
jgi:hypothetical protein